MKSKPSATQIFLSDTLAQDLQSLAQQEGKSIERLVFDLMVIYRSERLKREWMIERADRAIKLIREEAVANGTSEMTMEEIDEEIAAARREASVLAKTA